MCFWARSSPQPCRQVSTDHIRGSTFALLRNSPYDPRWTSSNLQQSSSDILQRNCSRSSSGDAFGILSLLCTITAVSLVEWGCIGSIHSRINCMILVLVEIDTTVWTVLCITSQRTQWDKNVDHLSLKTNLNMSTVFTLTWCLDAVNGCFMLIIFLVRVMALLHHITAYTVAVHFQNHRCFNDTLFKETSQTCHNQQMTWHVAKHWRANTTRTSCCWLWGW